MDSIKKAQITGIPSWQKAQGRNATFIDSPQPFSAQDASQSSEAESPLAIARRLLANPSIQNASVEQKKTFLASKGVSLQDIEVAMKLNTEDSNTPIQLRNDTASSQTISPSPSEAGLPPTQLFSTSSFQQASRSQPINNSSSLSPPPATQSAPLGPPIITYPEALSHFSHPKPTPLITLARLTTAAYILGTLSATVYGTSRFLLNPMISTLSDARIEFASNAKDKLEGLNERLERVVTVVPQRRGEASRSKRIVETAAEDDDATACFTREEGTQTAGLDTTAIPARTTTISSTSSIDSHASTSPASEVKTSTDTVDDQIASLTRIRALISTQHDAAQCEEDAADSIHSSLSDLRSYLFKLEASRYTSSSIGGLGGYGDASLASEYTDRESGRKGKWTKDGDGKKVDGSAVRGRERVDEVKEARKAVSDIKSVLLSARNFPGVRAR